MQTNKIVKAVKILLCYGVIQTVSFRTGVEHRLLVVLEWLVAKHRAGH